MNQVGPKKFPIGLSTLEKIVSDDFFYVDKTAYVEKLVQQGQYYFLSRPRRFGKSLLIDTLKQAFLGNKDLFNGLYLEKNWNWEETYPVIHFSFASNQVEKTTDILKIKIESLLSSNAVENQVVLRGELYSIQFTNLITDIYDKYHKKVVILIDEYDKPILDAIKNFALAEESRNILRGLYSVIKELDGKIHFTLLTGVSKFGKAGVFSGLNNLNDITYDPQYGAICGYTQNELEETFGALLKPEELTETKRWYNGYSFLGAESVYNPFSILNFFAKNKHYANYWFASGTPTFLVQLLQKRKFYIPHLESIEVTDSSLLGFDIEKLPLVILLLQTGYLTFQSSKQRGARTIYTLSYPNLEVRHSLNDSLASMCVDDEVKNATYQAMDEALSQHRFDALKDVFSSLFSAIPHDWYRRNDIQHYEGFYCAIIYAYFMGLGYKTIAEDVTSQGRIDLTVFLENSIIIIEFKLSTQGNAASAIAQIKEKHYADKYVSHKKTIYLLGLSFDPLHRNVQDCVFESVK